MPEIKSLVKKYSANYKPGDTKENIFEAIPYALQQQQRDFSQNREKELEQANKDYRREPLHVVINGQEEPMIQSVKDIQEIHDLTQKQKDYILMHHQGIDADIMTAVDTNYSFVMNNQPISPQYVLKIDRQKGERTKVSYNRSKAYYYGAIGDINEVSESAESKISLMEQSISTDMKAENKSEEEINAAITLMGDVKENKKNEIMSQKLNQMVIQTEADLTNFTGNKTATSLPPMEIKIHCKENLQDRSPLPHDLSAHSIKQIGQESLQSFLIDAFMKKVKGQDDKKVVAQELVQTFRMLAPDGVHQEEKLKWLSKQTVKPLLFITRKEVESYLKQLEQPFESLLINHFIKQVGKEDNQQKVANKFIQTFSVLAPDQETKRRLEHESKQVARGIRHQDGQLKPMETVKFYLQRVINKILRRGKFAEQIRAQRQSKNSAYQGIYI